MVIADISAEAGMALAAELGPHAAYVTCDVRRDQLARSHCDLLQTQCLSLRTGTTAVQGNEAKQLQRQHNAGRRRILSPRSRSERSVLGRCI